MKRSHWIALITLLLTGCLSPLVLEVEPTPTETLVPTSTPTIIWFPPTSTPEPSPTFVVTATPEIMVELGEIVFRDDFLSSEGWTIPQSDRGQINIGNGEMNIIINEPGSLFVGTLEKPDLVDFYAEISANPVLCTPKDEYGFLFRVAGRNQYYRFALNCDGELRLDTILQDASSIQFPWTRSGSVPVGAPSVSRMAVLAQGDQIILFINGDLQVSITDSKLSYGSFGVYARSVGETAVTISFSDLVVREILSKE